MCGRYTVYSLDDLERIAFSTERPWGEEWHDRRPSPIPLSFSPSYNVAPSQDAPIVVRDDDARQLVLARWGFHPAWLHNPKVPIPINAKAETVSTSGMFRGALARGRCLVPADGFYEWKALDGKRKQPMYIHLREGSLLTFAGLATQDPDGTLTYAIITTEANELMADIHNRMPVIVAPEDAATWLDPAVRSAEVVPLLRPYPAEQMQAYPVSSAVGNVRNNGPHLLERVETAD